MRQTGTINNCRVFSDFYIHQIIGYTLSDTTVPTSEVHRSTIVTLPFIGKIQKSGVL
jgi:hypothetical protein